MTQTAADVQAQFCGVRAAATCRHRPTGTKACVVAISMQSFGLPPIRSSYLPVRRMVIHVQPMYLRVPPGHTSRA